jgi:chaperone modulatory protein CbpM
MGGHATTSVTSSAATPPSRALVVVRPTGLSLETFSRTAGLHPDLVRRLVSLGLLEARTDAIGELSLPPAQLAVAARVQRLRAGLALNYAAIGLVMDLLDRIAQLEDAQRTAAIRRTAL